MDDQSELTSIPAVDTGDWADGKNYKQEEAVPHLLDTNELLLRAETPVDAPGSWRGGSVLL